MINSIICLNLDVNINTFTVRVVQQSLYYAETICGGFNTKPIFFWFIIGNFAIGEYVTEEAVLDMMLMLEDFYFEQCVIMMRKSSPFTEKVNQLVGRLHQSGLLLAWETQVPKYIWFFN